MAFLVVTDVTDRIPAQQESPATAVRQQRGTAEGSINVEGSVSTVESISAATTVAIQQDAEPESILADGGRSLAKAVFAFEQRCHCVVTYEDPPWRSDQVQALPGYRPGPETPKVPKSNPFRFTIPRDIEALPRDRVEMWLKRLLSAYEEANGNGTFRILAQSRVFHVLPVQDALLDTPITLPSGERSLFEAVNAIAKATSASAREDIGIATIPVNLAMRTKVNLGADKERAGDVLARALAMANQKLSWRLLYDFDYGVWYLNVHVVH